MTESRLQGKAVVVTGSGRGIGAECAKHAASHGASVVVNDVDGDEAASVAGEIRQSGGRAIAVIADISSWDGAEALVASCVSEFGRIDGLMNNAGVLTMSNIDQQTEADARSMIDINLFGVVACGTFAARRMRDQGSGSIVNVCSGAQCGTAGQAVYSATKGGVASLTYAWAMELAGTGVRVNGLSPRANTRMFEYNNEYRAQNGIGFIHDTPTPGPAANAPLVSYLLSDLASDVTGQIVRVDGQLLGLYTHPAVRLPVQRRDEWTVDDVAEAFATTELGEQQVPLGIVGIKVDGFEVAMKEWQTV